MFRLQFLEFSYLIILVCLNVATESCLAQESCGSVKGNFFIANKGLSCLLEFTPSAYFKPHSSPSTVSWVRVYSHTERKVIDPREFRTEFETWRYVQAGTSILIHNVTSRDNGNYSLYCWIDQMSLPMTKSWMLMAPTLLYSAKTTPATNEDTALPIDSSAIIVVALCTVAVVLIVAVTVVIVRKRKPKAGTCRLMSASGDNTKSRLRGLDSNSLYNEIGYVDLIFDPKVETASMHGSRFHLESPSLPKRPNNMPKNINAPSTSRVSENEIATIQDNSSIRKSESTNTDIKIDKIDEYAKIVSKTKRSLSLQTGLLENRPMYANFIPKAERHASETRILEVLHVPRERTKSDGNIRQCQRTKKPTLNAQSVDNRTENKKLSTNSKEPQLMYAVLAHVTPESVQGAVACELGNNERVQYAQIDFEKKAFVAPIRRAPSSWYKRHLKKKNKN